VTRSITARAGCAAAALLAASSTAALAQDSSVLNRQNRGFYVGAGAGANFLSDNDFRHLGTDTKTKYDAGLVGTLSLGYALGNGLRVELEPGYRYNDVDTVGGVDGHGRLQTFSVMANAIYDIDIHTPIVPLVPHIGAGIGYAKLWNRSFPYPPAGFTLSGSDDTLAYQASAGGEYALTPAMKLGLDYRYFVASGTDFKINEVPGVTSHVGDVQNHSVLLTFRYEFGAPAQQPQPAAYTPPPPPPVQQPPATPVAPPAAAVPTTYQVFFDFNRADVDPSARPVIAQAASNAKRGNVTRITVTGHTDTVGSDRYNQRLSERRADAVRRELIRQGVPADEIVTVGRGKTDLAVPTPNGVREPRNRRVVIETQAPGA
jgi:outer membrane protein OmpA-like peptidoglycan-associated protein